MMHPGRRLYGRARDTSETKPPPDEDLVFLARYEHEPTPATFLEYARRQLTDSDMPVRPYAGIGKFRFNESGLCYMPGHKPREPTRHIRLAAIGLGPARSRWWWEAQFRLYGVPFKPGTGYQEAATQALAQGLFVEPPPKLKAIEHRLAAQFQEIRQRHLEKLREYYNEKREVARKLPAKGEGSVRCSPATNRRSSYRAETDMTEWEI